MAPASENALDGLGSAPDEPLYARLHELEQDYGTGWTMLATPMLMYGFLVAVMVRPTKGESGE